MIYSVLQAHLTTTGEKLFDKHLQRWASVISANKLVLTTQYIDTICYKQSFRQLTYT